MRARPPFTSPESASPGRSRKSRSIRHRPTAASANRHHRLMVSAYSPPPECFPISVQVPISQAGCPQPSVALTREIEGDTGNPYGEEVASAWEFALVGGWAIAGVLPRSIAGCRAEKGYELPSGQTDQLRLPPNEPVLDEPFDHAVIADRNLSYNGLLCGITRRPEIAGLAAEWQGLPCPSCCARTCPNVRREARERHNAKPSGLMAPFQHALDAAECHSRGGCRRIAPHPA